MNGQVKIIGRWEKGFDDLIRSAAEKDNQVSEKVTSVSSLSHLVIVIEMNESMIDSAQITTAQPNDWPYDYCHPIMHTPRTLPQHNKVRRAVHSIDYA